MSSFVITGPEEMQANGGRYKKKSACDKCRTSKIKVLCSDPIAQSLNH